MTIQNKLDFHFVFRSYFSSIEAEGEVKRRRAEKGDASQLNRHIEALEEKKEKKVRGFLLAPKLTEGAESYLDKKVLSSPKFVPSIKKRYGPEETSEN